MNLSLPGICSGILALSFDERVVDRESSLHWKHVPLVFCSQGHFT
jgi:hypothetical protein